MATVGNVASTTFSTPSDREIMSTRVFDAPRRLVWEAWTNPKHVPQWLLGPAGWTMPVCEIDLRPGGEWHFVWRRSDGTAGDRQHARPHRRRRPDGDDDDDSLSVEGSSRCRNGNRYEARHDGQLRSPRGIPKGERINVILSAAKDLPCLAKSRSFAALTMTDGLRMTRRYLPQLGYAGSFPAIAGRSRRWAIANAMS